MVPLTITVNDGIKSASYELDDRHARTNAGAFKPGLDKVSYSFFAGKYGYLVLKNNNLGRVPSVTLFEVPPSSLLNVEFGALQSTFKPEASLFILFYDEEAEVTKFRMAVGSGVSRGSFYLPNKPGRVAIALRLRGHSDLRALSFSYRLSRAMSEPTVAPSKALPKPVAVARASSAPLQAPSLASPAKSEPAPLLTPPTLQTPLLPWRAIFWQSREAGRRLHVVGVACPRGEAASCFELVRVDEDLRIDGLSSTAGYLFDVSASEFCFGWEGVLTPANNLANEALVRQLRAVRAAKLPTVVVYDAAAMARPFYKDVQPLFSHHIDQRTLHGDDILPGPFESL